MRVPAGCRLGSNPLPLLLVLVSVSVSVSPAAGEVMEPIYWNSHNERFAAPLGYVLFPQIGDRIDLICPRALATGPGSPAGPRSPAVYEYYRLYLVSREQADRCDTVLSPTVLLTCDQPAHDTRFTIKFQEYSPNLWGLEFQPQHNYYIITTSDGSKEGLENRNEGACNTRNMKVTLRVGQDPASLDPAPDAETPSSGPRHRDGFTLEGANSSVSLGNGSSGGGRGADTRPPPSLVLIGGVSGAAGLLVLVGVGVGVGVWAGRRRRRRGRGRGGGAGERSGLHLSTLTGPKLGVGVGGGGGPGGSGAGGGGNNNGSEPSDIIIPLRTSDSAFCPHYEKVSGDYGHPVYIVQEMPPQSPANIYYKV